MGHLGQIQNRSHMVPICDPYRFALVSTTGNRVANPISVPYGVPIYGPYKIPYRVRVGPTSFADWVTSLELLATCKQFSKSVRKLWFRRFFDGFLLFVLVFTMVGLKCDFYLILLNSFHMAACYRFAIELDMLPMILIFFFILFV